MEKRKVIVYKEVVTVHYEPIEVDEDDPISIQFAVNLSGRAQPTISTQLTTGKLTAVYWKNPQTLQEGETQPRLALRSEVMALPKVKRDSEATSQVAQYKGYYLAPLCPVIETASLSPAPVDGPLLPVLN